MRDVSAAPLATGETETNEVRPTTLSVAKQPDGPREPARAPRPARRPERCRVTSNEPNSHSPTAGLGPSGGGKRGPIRPGAPNKPNLPVQLPFPGHQTGFDVPVACPATQNEPNFAPDAPSPGPAARGPVALPIPVRQTKPMCDRISLGKEEDHG